MNIFHSTVAAALLSTVAIAVPVMAAEVVVTPSSSNWSNLPGEARGGATAIITGAAPRSGNGSLELSGSRTRFATGVIYPNGSTAHMAELRDVTGLTFDWRIAGDSVNPYNVDYTPALRLHIWDAGANNGAGVRKEMIWEGAYNSVYGAQTNPDVWYSTSINDKFYIGAGNENSGKTVAEWAAILDRNSFVAGISVGSGGGAGAYHAFADNVTFSTVNGSTTFNFELVAGAVPEPATWTMMISGFGLIGAAARRRAKALAVIA